MAHNWRGSNVQSLLFTRSKWSVGHAMMWAHAHGYKHHKVDVTEGHIRLRQFTPHKNRTKRTITFGKGIKAVIEQA